MPALHLGIFRIPRCTWLQLVRCLLIRCIQGTPYFPPQATPLPCFILRELPRYVVELGAVAELRYGFFFL